MHIHQQSWRSFLSVCLTGASLVLLSLAEVQYDYDGDTTPAPDYGDYNATFEYSFFSNTSSEDLDKFLSSRDGDQEVDGEVAVAVTTVTTTTEGDQMNSAASLPGTLASSLLLLSLLQHTL